MTHRARTSRQRSWPRVRPRFRTNRAAADELFKLMDDVVAGRGKELPPEHMAPEILATAHETQDELAHGPAHLDERRQQRIWEDIMSSTSPAAMEALPSRTGRGRDTRQRQAATRATDRRPYPSARPFINAAFVVVLVVAVIGGAKAWMGGGGGEPPRSYQLAAPANLANPNATPNATPMACKVNCDYSQPGPPIFWSANTTIGKQYLASSDLDARKVQLLDWKVSPGATVSMPADDEGGVIVDTVLDGAAVMTIDGPATVVRRNDPLRGFFDFPKAGEKVELSRGDTIVYSATHKRTIVNPLALTTLHTKSAVFFNGDATRFQPAADASGVSVKVNGENTMARPLSTIVGAGSDFTFVMNYIQIYPGTEVPEQRHSLTRVLGPVDAVAGPAGSEGYFIWIGPSMG